MNAEISTYIPSAANLRKLTEEQEAEWKQQFLAECNRRLRENVRVELEPFRMLECERRWLEEEKQKNALEKQQSEVIFTYTDGSNYMGQMLEGKKHGRGTLRTAAFIYGGEKAAANYTSDEAAENGHMVNWHEYIGMWKNDKMHGFGRHIRKFGNGREHIMFEGEWIDGKAQDNDVEY
jgi:hypothetical protein